jgi:mannosyltransferase OCH1-like enzyme
VDKVTQADIWRYVTLYLHGGNYSDMDSVCSMPLDYLTDGCPLDIEIIATPQDEKGIANNANFACKKGSKIIRLILENIICKYKNKKLIDVLNITKELDMSILEATAYELTLSPDDYSNVLLENKDKVLFSYSSEIHGDYIKETNFSPSHNVNYYGSSINYLDLAKEKNWSLA